MTSVAAGDGAQLGPAAENQGRRRAAGIYGAIITAAAILDTAGGHVSTTALVVSVVVTLLVYWIAEEYAEVLGAQAGGGHLPNRAFIQDALVSTWPMVTASYLPLLAVVVAKVAGASALTAANVGLVVAMVLLTVHGWLAARAARLQGWKLLGGELDRGGAGSGDDLAEGPGPDPLALTAPLRPVAVPLTSSWPAVCHRRSRSVGPGRVSGLRPGRDGNLQVDESRHLHGRVRRATGPSARCSRRSIGIASALARGWNAMTSTAQGRTRCWCGSACRPPRS